MRTFPKALSKFRDIVSERGQYLRKLPFEELKRLGGSPAEHLIVESRPSAIGIIVRSAPSGGIKVVVQGFMNARVVPLLKHVALDGFYKYPDETITPMPDEEFSEFD
jgi:hypothetical protein